MQFLLILIISIILLALMLMGIGLKTIFKKDKPGSIHACQSPGHKGQNCVCRTNDNCINMDA
jgi:hypothetical protein